MSGASAFHEIPPWSWSRQPRSIRQARAIAAVVLVGLVPVVSGCGVVGFLGESGANGRPVTFKGTLTAESMEPTLMSGDRVVATEVDASGPRVGDVVVFTNPDRWLGLTGNAGEGNLVHRVLGTPGDTVTCCGPDGRIAVNGEPIDEPYLGPDPGACNAPIFDWATQPGSARRGACDWTIGPVPDGMLFVLGDNRGHAADSRFHICSPDEDPCSESPWVPIDLVRGIVELP